MKKQLHIGKLENKEKLVFDYTNNGINKPEKAFWTSSYHPKGGSDWVQFYLSEFHTPWNNEEETVQSENQNHELTCTIIQPHKETRVCEIKTRGDLEEIMELYCYEEKYNSIYGMQKRQYLDFEALSKNFDAINLTYEGQSATRHSYPNNLYGWDVECTLWLNPTFEIEFVGKKEFELMNEAVLQEEIKNKIEDNYVEIMKFNSKEKLVVSVTEEKETKNKKIEKLEKIEITKNKDKIKPLKEMKDIDLEI